MRPVGATAVDDLLTIAAQYRPVLQSLLAELAPGSSLSVVKDLVGGRSGADVLLHRGLETCASLSRSASSPV